MFLILQSMYSTHTSILLFQADNQRHWKKQSTNSKPSFSKLTIHATEKKQSTNSKPHTLQSYMPSRQSTAPRRRHRCTACTAPVRQATAACAVLSVPAARGNDAPRCPDDCAPPETHGPTANSSIHFKCCLYSLSACSCSNTLGSTTCKLHSTVHYWWDNQEERTLAWVWCPWV